ncbi:alcohol dehydrogenase-like regulatory protein ErcA [Anaeroselena agilis]|uniref:Alcohol dehydrogenase-like regulatory protein ErcA n=1 Tax=Anaeroselena agilis TaxID=3063788 RepID=A0ABU3P068_9FIRM|nr:alcohol dehydrogenase-like regulatory protein ErcA [Selenomonadales bacterium 4137-cl]
MEATSVVEADPFLELRKFVAPEFVFGLDARKLVGRYAQNVGARRVLLVTDKVLHARTPWVRETVATLEEYGIPCVVFDGVSPNPRSAEVTDGAACYARERCNAVVAVGGGSVMDCAKGIGIVCSNGGGILDFEGVDRVGRPMPPLICLPTTAGTASEVSQFTIILDENRKTKIAIVSKATVPDVGLIDPATTMTMDAYLTACTGMDALTHAVEAFVSNAGSPITDLHAMEAIRLVHAALPAVIARPDDIGLRGRMMLGSLQAGLAFSNAILGAVHAMAHSLGGFLDLPHGECNAILLGPVIAGNYGAAREKYQAVGRVFGLSLAGMTDEAAAAALREAVEAFRRGLGITATLGSLGVERTSVSLLAALALKDACMATNPRALSLRATEAIYESAF